MRRLGLIYRFGAATLALCMGSTGCTIFGSDLEREQQLEELSGCRGDASDPEALDTIMISEEYGDSLHEMVACGQLTVLFCTAIIGAVVESIQSGGEGRVPQGWSYDNGIYHTENTGVTMDLELFTSEESALGPAGTRIEHNVFLVDSYLVGASASVDLQDQSVSISFEGTGPLVDLMGFGAEPTSPLRVTLGDLDDVGNALGKIAFESTVKVDDDRENATIRYHVDADRMTAADVVRSGGIPYNMVLADGDRDDLQQVLTVTDWTIEFVDHGTLDGYTEFDVTGNHFDFSGRLTFDNSPLPERELRCQ